MSTLSLEDKTNFKNFKIKDNFLIIKLTTGKIIKRTIDEIPCLKKANKKQIMKYEIMGDGEGVHWPLLDEDLSAAYLVHMDRY